MDNHPAAAVSTALVERGLPVTQLVTGSNLGYPQACNFAAPHASGEWLFFLNPDAQAAPDCLERLLEEAGDDVAVLGAQVLLPDGAVNAGDNPVHLVGLSWSGRYREPRENGAARDVACVSGAASLIRAATFRALCGHSPGFFLYVDDTDIAWRTWLAGMRVRFVPRAVITHDYEFDKGVRKWLHLEHNRLWMVLANYRLATLLALAPLLLAAEAGIAVLARRDGWWPEKVEAWRTAWAERRQIAAWRRFVQGTPAAGRRGDPRADDGLAAHAAGAGVGGRPGRAGPRGVPPAPVRLSLNPPTDGVPPESVDPLRLTHHVRGRPAPRRRRRASATGARTSRATSTRSPAPSSRGAATRADDPRERLEPVVPQARASPPTSTTCSTTPGSTRSCSPRRCRRTPSSRCGCSTPASTASSRSRSAQSVADAERAVEAAEAHRARCSWSATCSSTTRASQAQGDRRRRRARRHPLHLRPAA